MMLAHIHINSTKAVLGFSPACDIKQRPRALRASETTPDLYTDISPVQGFNQSVYLCDLHGKVKVESIAQERD
jgi:hypothetical protein